MAAAEAKSFDVVLIDDTSRLSRDMSDSMNLSKRLRFLGVRVVFVSQNIDSESEQSDVLVGVHGIVDQLYIKELGKKTFRGVEGRALAKLHTGGRIFGYRRVPIEDPDHLDLNNRPVIRGARLVVDEDQARTVRKIFTLYGVSGLSIKTIAKRLNAEVVRSPQPRAGRQQSWAPSSVRVILHNERYRGVVTWAKSRKVRNPMTGRRVKRARPESEWVRVEIEEQRIVSDELWSAVAERVAFLKKTFANRGRNGAYSPYLFSGLLRCGVCGANVGIVSGVGRGHKSVTYGCPTHAFRGTCSNSRRVSRDVLERELLSKLQNDVLSDAAIDYCLEKLDEEIEKREAVIDDTMRAVDARKAALESEIENLSRALAATGPDSPAIRKAITDREAELAGLTENIVGRKKNSVRRQMDDLRKFVKTSLRDIRGLLNAKHANVAIVRQELAKHIGSITLLPEGDGGAITYKGKWDLLGTGGTRGSSSGAEGQS